MQKLLWNPSICHIATFGENSQASYYNLKIFSYDLDLLKT